MIFLLCAGAVIYVMAGYPCLLALLARFRTKSVARARIDRTISVLLPVHNGEAWIEAKLENLLTLDYPRELVEILVISDGSTDGTDEIAARFPVRLIRIPKSGKAAALNRGLEHATGEILFFTDVRQRLDAQALRKLVDCFADPAVGVATGELIILAGQTREEVDVGRYWKYEKWLRRRLSRVDSVLGATGCIYAMRRSLARPMPAGTLLDDVHLPMQAFFAGYRIVMEEEALAFDLPTGFHTEFWRKVRTQAGVLQLLMEFPALLWPGTRMWLHFMSYKFGRLLLPYFVIGATVSAFYLPEPWGRAVVVAETLFYFLALLNAWVPREWRLKQATSPPSLLLVLAAAAVCAISIFFIAPDRLWTQTVGRPQRSPT